MSQTNNVYCDENCHMENDHQSLMVLGAVWCPIDKVRDITERLREIKQEQGLNSHFELKWTKVSPAKLVYYHRVMDYFFDDDDLHFRALIVPDKSKLQHTRFNQDHDDWYYKMYFDLLKILLTPDAQFNIYLDIKDTRSAPKIARLHDVLSNNVLDFDRSIIRKVQTVRSHEVEILQLADLLIGAVSYANRNLQTSEAKLALVQRMRTRSHYHLDRSTLYRESKVNLFHWRARE
jgi:hypothetical protein